MVDDKHPVPLQYKGVMISSTFTDLKGHRAAIIKAIDAQGLKPVVMENDSAKPAVDVIDSSLQWCGTVRLTSQSSVTNTARFRSAASAIPTGFH